MINGDDNSNKGNSSFVSVMNTVHAVLPPNVLLEAALKMPPEQSANLQKILDIAKKDPAGLRAFYEQNVGPLPTFLPGAENDPTQLPSMIESGFKSLREKLGSPDSGFMPKMQQFLSENLGIFSLGKVVDCGRAAEFYDYKPSTQVWSLKKDPYHVPNGQTPGDFVHLNVPRLGEISHCRPR